MSAPAPSIVGLFADLAAQARAEAARADTGGVIAALESLLLAALAHLIQRIADLAAQWAAGQLPALTPNPAAPRRIARTPTARTPAARRPRPARARTAPARPRRTDRTPEHRTPEHQGPSAPPTSTQAAHPGRHRIRPPRTHPPPAPKPPRRQNPAFAAAPAHGHFVTISK